MKSWLSALPGDVGAVELAGVGIAISVFNTVTKLFNVPLLAVTTSLVATAEGSKTKGKAMYLALYLPNAANMGGSTAATASLKSCIVESANKFCECWSESI